MGMTQQEAEDQFISAKKSYYEAEQRRAQLSNQMDNYRAEKKYAAEQISSARGERTNFEKRLRGIESIIKMLEGTGWSSKNAPQSIDKANSALQSANSNYQQCIRLSGGVSAADMEETFHAKSVEEDANSGQALEAYRREKERLAQAIEDLNRMIDGFSEQMSELTGKINACSAEQSSVRRVMMSSACQMAQCRFYM